MLIGNPFRPSQVCRCGSGEKDCDIASAEEIEILLIALTSPAESVRDASLRSLTVLKGSFPTAKGDPVRHR